MKLGWNFLKVRLTQKQFWKNTRNRVQRALTDGRLYHLLAVRASLMKEHGFDANQDIPGNMLWEELYAASPKGQKVKFKIIKDH